MMNILKIVNFSGMADCVTREYCSRESFPAVTFDFQPGNIYGFISDYGCGSWGLASCLAGKGRWDSKGKAYIGEKLVNQAELKKISGIILDPVWNEFDSINQDNTVHQCIEYALQISRQQFCHGEIKDMFCLTDARYNRPIVESSGEIWNVYLAILFALNKNIFIYPWLNSINIKRVVYLKEQGTLEFLKNQGKIVFIPSSQKKILTKICDKSIEFDITLKNAKIKYW